MERNEHVTRFLHTGDWQLGMTRHFFSEGVQERFAQSRFNVLREFGRIAEEEDCRFMVVCGDVFESNLVDLNSGELRLIEVKGLATATGTILLMPNERRVVEDRRDCYWLYIVTNCATKPILQEPVKDLARLE